MNQRRWTLMAAAGVAALWLATPSTAQAQFYPGYGYGGGFYGGFPGYGYPGGFGPGFGGPGFGGGFRGGPGVGGLHPPGVSINQGMNTLVGLPTQQGQLGGGFGMNRGFGGGFGGGYGFPGYGYPGYGYPGKFGFGNGGYGY